MLDKYIGIGSEHDKDVFGNVYDILCDEDPDAVGVEGYINSSRAALDLLCSQRSSVLRDRDKDSNFFSGFLSSDYGIFAGIKYAFDNCKQLYLVDTPIRRLGHKEDNYKDLARYEIITSADDCVSIDLNEISSFRHVSCSGDFYYEFDDKRIFDVDQNLMLDALVAGEDPDNYQTMIDAEAVYLRNEFSAKVIDMICDKKGIRTFAHVSGKAHFNIEDYKAMVEENGIKVECYNSMFDLIKSKDVVYHDACVMLR